MNKQVFGQSKREEVILHIISYEKKACKIDKKGILS